MPIKSSRERLQFAIAILAIACGLLASFEASAAEDARNLGPISVIYPGDIISGDMLVAMPADSPAAAHSAPLSALLGKRAKRTLIPGRAITPADVENPRAVTNGAQVTLIYHANGLTIVATGQALQNGSLGDVVRVRNIDSGLTVSGDVQGDGSILVGE